MKLVERSVHKKIRKNSKHISKHNQVAINHKTKDVIQIKRKTVGSPNRSKRGR